MLSQSPNILLKFPDVADVSTLSVLHPLRAKLWSNMGSNPANQSTNESYVKIENMTLHHTTLLRTYFFYLRGPTNIGASFGQK